MQEFPQGADRAAGRFGFAETRGLRPWRRRRAPPGLRPGPCPPCSPLPGAGSLPPAPPPAHFCRAAGLRPAGQTVLRTVLGGGLRPPPRRRPAPPALRAALPLQAPRHPHAKAPAGTAGASPLFSIPPSARPPAPPQSSSRCPPTSPAAAPSGRAKTPPYPSRRCGSARIPSGSRCKAATHCAE